MRHKDSYSAIFWLNVKDETTVRQSFVTIAKRIVRYHPSARYVSATDLTGNLEDIVDAVKSWLSEADNRRWLTIYDNYDNPKVQGNSDPSAVDVREFLPDAHQGSVIITTRSAQVRLGRSIQVRKLADAHESADILSSMARRELSVEGKYISHCYASTKLTQYQILTYELSFRS